jgi:hypothetical protein
MPGVGAIVSAGGVDDTSLSCDSGFSGHQCIVKFLEDEMRMKEVESLTVGMLPLTKFNPTIAAVERLLRRCGEKTRDCGRERKHPLKC